MDAETKSNTFLASRDEIRTFGQIGGILIRKRRIKPCCFMYIRCRYPALTLGLFNHIAVRLGHVLRLGNPNPAAEGKHPSEECQACRRNIVLRVSFPYVIFLNSASAQRRLFEQYPSGLISTRRIGGQKFYWYFIPACACNVHQAEDR